ncbi:PilZ domain-containing protein [Halioxenophilus sp. WMMB6]|uniref:PilZ domain-containing protein n=1 Tax=Halioxenophilus sp. WMMB6 TaxID=3073815 RepID=UPI00295E9DC4|nr:PilZ domain-containing protein [Halioxenophilus sp. WMMB6]
MTEPSNAHAEKRGFIRMQVNTPAEIIISADGQQARGTCLNLSGNGMLLEVEQPHAIGSILVVFVSSDHGHSPSIEAECTVMRSEPVDDTPNRHLIGVTINRIL